MVHLYVMKLFCHATSSKIMVRYHLNYTKTILIKRVSQLDKTLPWLKYAQTPSISKHAQTHSPLDLLSPTALLQRRLFSSVNSPGILILKSYIFPYYFSHYTNQNPRFM